MRLFVPAAELESDRFLPDWEWLLPKGVRLLGMNLFADMFFASIDGAVYMLNLQDGNLKRIADSENDFLLLKGSDEYAERWLYRSHVMTLVERGFRLTPGQCFAYKIPCCIAVSPLPQESIYVADVWEYISFLGDFHRQIRDVPDGGKVVLKVNDTGRVLRIEGQRTDNQ